MRDAIGPSRRRILTDSVRSLGAALESRDEVSFAITLLQERGRALNRHSIAAHETLSRQFLQRRHQLFGMDYPGPWPVEFVEPLEVWHKKEGFDFAAGKPYTKMWTARISKARFVALGQRQLARYVELELKRDEIIPPEDWETYGYLNNQSYVPVYCTLRTLITARPEWVINTQTRVQIARVRNLARIATGEKS